MEEEGKGRIKVVVVGGSVGGLSCVHALLRAGCELVAVLEKARSITPLGAGLALDEVQCCPALRHWGLGEALAFHSIPLAVEENRAVEKGSKALHRLIVNERHNCQAMHWSDLHKLLYDALDTSAQRLVYWGHELVSFKEVLVDGNAVVQAVAKDLHTSCCKVFEADLLVAADGCNSRVRAHLLPNDKRRYAGYCAWRGIVNKADASAQSAIMGMRERFPNIGNTVYVDMTGDSHTAVFEIPRGRINWLWYVNQEEPNFQGRSLTSRAKDEDIEKMISDAKEVLTHEMVELMKVTKAPFLQAICDKEPLKQMVWGKVVLLGEAAHPTTPHAARSTNMSIMDAVTLGNCIRSHGLAGLPTALDHYEKLRLPATTQQVLFSRYIGQLKQGHLHPKDFSWLDASPSEYAKLVQAHWDSFHW